MQDFIRRAQLANLTFHYLDPSLLFVRGTIANANIFLGLLEPSAQGLEKTANLGCDGRKRTRLRFV